MAVGVTAPRSGGSLIHEMDESSAAQQRGVAGSRLLHRAAARNVGWLVGAPRSGVRVDGWYWGAAKRRDGDVVARIAAGRRTIIEGMVGRPGANPIKGG